jgi:hypothetical protein
MNVEIGIDPCSFFLGIYESDLVCSVFTQNNDKCNYKILYNSRSPKGAAT